MKTTHTHTGHCQLCDRVQAVSNSSGEMAKHGYTVEWGFFSGTCPGSGELPYEKSNSAIGDQIVIAKGRIESMIKQAAELRARTDNKAHVEVYFSHGEYSNRSKGGYHSIECEFVDEQITTRDGYRWNKVHAYYTHAGKQGDAYKSRSHQYNSAAAAAAGERERSAVSILSRAEQFKNYVRWLTDRKDSWKLADLTPVAAPEPSALDLKPGDKLTVYGHPVTVTKLASHQWNGGTEVRFTYDNSPNSAACGSINAAALTRMLRKAVRS